MFCHKGDVRDRLRSKSNSTMTTTKVIYVVLQFVAIRNRFFPSDDSRVSLLILMAHEIGSCREAAEHGKVGARLMASCHCMNATDEHYQGNSTVFASGVKIISRCAILHRSFN